MARRTTCSPEGTWTGVGTALPYDYRWDFTIGGAANPQSRTATQTDTRTGAYAVWPPIYIFTSSLGFDVFEVWVDRGGGGGTGAWLFRGTLHDSTEYRLLRGGIRSINFVPYVFIPSSFRRP